MILHTLYNNDLINMILKKNSIEDVVSDVIPLKRRKDLLWGRCPFHNETAMSFTVDPKKQTFYCYGCGKGGNVISFTMFVNSCSFEGAIDILAKRAGIAIPDMARDEQYSLKKERLCSLNREAALFYHQTLWRNDKNQGWKYFTEIRKLSPKTIKRFGLGLSREFGQELLNHLVKLGYTHKEICASGLAGYNEKNEKYYDQFWNRVIFPILDETQKVIGFGARVLDDTKPKYLNSQETILFDKSHNLYAMNIAKKTASSYLILCEGYLDVISMHQHGFGNTVASLGTSLTYGQVRLIKKYTDKVYIAYDSDEAGKKATARAIEILKNMGIKSYVIDPAPYKDVDELLKKEGADGIYLRMRKSIEDDSFYVKSIRENTKNNCEFYDRSIDVLLKYTE